MNAAASSCHCAVRRVTVAGDRPAAEPRNCSNAGTKSLEITFGGVMTNDTGFETMQGYAWANSINAFAMQWADGDTIECSFAVSGFAVTGDNTGAQEFSVTLVSSGSWTFTAA